MLRLGLGFKRMVGENELVACVTSRSNGIRGRDRFRFRARARV